MRKKDCGSLLSYYFYDNYEILVDFNVAKIADKFRTEFLPHTCSVSI